MKAQELIERVASGESAKEALTEKPLTEKDKHLVIQDLCGVIYKSPSEAVEMNLDLVGIPTNKLIKALKKLAGK